MDLDTSGLTPSNLPYDERNINNVYRTKLVYDICTYKFKAELIGSKSMLN